MCHSSPFDCDLSPYAAVVLLNTPGDELKGAQRSRLEAYVRAGGGVMAVHRALIFNPPGEWPWFEKLIGRTFRIHPMVQTATVRVEDASFPATFGLPARWIWTDEWYEFNAPVTRGLRTVLSVDETSYDPTLIWPGQVAKGMGEAACQVAVCVPAPYLAQVQMLYQRSVDFLRAQMQAFVSASPNAVRSCKMLLQEVAADSGLTLTSENMKMSDGLES